LHNETDDDAIGAGAVILLTLALVAGDANASRSSTGHPLSLRMLDVRSSDGGASKMETEDDDDASD
jgi:hypothetical protein